MSRSACRTCGHTEVEAHVHPVREDDREGVFTTCVGCGNRRGAWTRKRRPVVGTAHDSHGRRTP